MKITNAILALTVLFALINMASAFNCAASDMCSIVCAVINSVRWTLERVAPTLVILMFIYGGVKYTFSADDPGGRKAGKMTCIHALIGGILILLAGTFVEGLFTNTCPAALFV